MQNLKMLWLSGLRPHWGSLQHSHRPPCWNN